MRLGSAALAGRVGRPTLETGNSGFTFDATRVFGVVAGEYQAFRPPYPVALYDRLEQQVGGLAGRTVADLGAGTGIASAGLASRGAVVVAIEPSLPMLATLRGAHPGIRVIAGRAESLPLGLATVDLVTCAQAWHWVDLAAAAPECRRVLRPGGQLALWWNVSDSGADWLAEIERASGLNPYGLGRHQDDRASLVDRGGFTAVRHEDIRWEWRVPVDHWLQTAATRSAIVRLGSERAGVLSTMRQILGQHFQNGHVTELFTCHLTVASA